MNQVNKPVQTQPENRVVPHSLEAEEAVLGSILIDPEALYRVHFLSAADFFLVKHQWIWQALTALSEHRQPVDYLTVCQELDRRTQLAEIGGQAYLSHLIGAVPTAIHAEGYGRIVEQHSIRRKLLAAASDIAQLAYAEEKDITDVLDQAQKAVYDIAPSQNGQSLEHLPPLLAEYYQMIEARYERRGEPTALGVPTGFADMDRLLGGLRKTDLIVLAARPSVGKTSLLLNIALNAATRFQQRVAIFSLEMSRDQVIERFVAHQSGIDSHKLRTGGLAEADWPVFVEATSHLSTNGKGLWIDDTPAVSPMQMRSRLRWLQAQHGLDLVVMDYLQLMSPGGKFENRVQEVSHISRSLKALAKELHVPVLAVSQLNRAIEQRADKKPLLSDLRESGSIEQDADVVLFLHRDDDKIFDLDAPMIPLDLIVAKHRKGPTGLAPLMFIKSLTQFVNGVVKEVML
ncbi:MAG: replicative DNA helicase [Thermoflexales bacterium]|nr:replicative DNA helicase [Thermoflexales bacterium]